MEENLLRTATALDEKAQKADMNSERTTGENDETKEGGKGSLKEVTEFRRSKQKKQNDVKTATRKKEFHSPKKFRKEKKNNKPKEGAKQKKQITEMTIPSEDDSENPFLI